MALAADYVTDPACPGSWALEPVRLRLGRELELEWRFVMAGVARAFDPQAALAAWLDVGETMPLDPRLWLDAPPASSHPACMAVKAAEEQEPTHPEAAARYLRALRIGLFCFRRKLDTVDALCEEARGAGLDADRLRRSLGSSAVAEAFAADLERAAGRPSPTIVLGGEALSGVRPYEDYRAAALAAGAVERAGPPPDPLTALRAHGRLATAEVAALCDLPGPRAAAELWRLATDWRVRPLRVLTGELWEAA